MQQHDTPGLNASQAAARERYVRQWLRRIQRLMQISGCSAHQALQAIEQADKES